MLLSNRSRRPVLAGGGLLLFVMMLGGCERDWDRRGQERVETRDIELDNAEEVRVHLNLGAGELRVRGGASKLLEGRFVYNRLRMRPEVSYHSFASRGDLDIEQPRGEHSSGPYRWELAFNNQKPLDLELNCGAGQSRLDLGDLTLRHVEVHMGVGELHLDLRGTVPKNDYNVSINGGIGQATIYLPQGVGIEADAQGGIGSISASGLEKRSGRGHYVNEALGHAPVTVRLEINGGIGDIRLIAQ
jgi:hypothetical protein